MADQSSSNGLKVRAFKADGSVLLAFDLDPSLTPGLAGFAIQCTAPDGQSYYLDNLLDFSTQVTSDTPAGQEPRKPSTEAPIQKFRWSAYPRAPLPGQFTYTVTPMYFADDTSSALKPAAFSASVSIEYQPITSGAMQLGFTRGFLTSQAYIDMFKNDLAFKPDNYDGWYFDTKPYEQKYQWLGGTARPMINTFLEECLQNPDIHLDVFAYDLDEPDIISKFVQMGPRLRLIQDNSAEHLGATKKEPLVVQALKQSAGADHIVEGCFERFSHSKVLIQTIGGKAVKVLAGSANFSIRGLYVQANNVFIFNDPTIAGLYEEAFDCAFQDMSHFKEQHIAQNWFPIPGADQPEFSFCFSPHSSSDLSIRVMADAIKKARSSVLFAIMEINPKSGDVMAELLDPGELPDVFFYGITQRDGGINVYKPSENAVLTQFSALDKKVLPPFHTEWAGGEGQVIHHKFLVVDFNGPNPVVFAGSSNLSKGGEMDNGDNLVAFSDPQIAEAYAAEAIRLVDHYHFRSKVEQADTPEKALTLTGNVHDGTEWWRPYYDPKNVAFLERELFFK